MKIIEVLLEVWERIMETEVADIDRKQILHLRKSKSNTGILIETGIWPVEERLEYNTMMIYHSIMSSNDKTGAKKIIGQQNKDIITQY